MKPSSSETSKTESAYYLQYFQHCATSNSIVDLILHGPSKARKPKRSGGRSAKGTQRQFRSSCGPLRLWLFLLFLLFLFLCFRAFVVFPDVFAGLALLVMAVVALVKKSKRTGKQAGKQKKQRKQESKNNRKQEKTKAKKQNRRT